MLTKNQFALLSYIAARPAGEPALSQRAIAQGTGKALGTVNGMVKELSATETLQTDFISSVSHEFKTPINAIEGYAVPGGQRRHYGGGHELALCPPVV